jgi:hypothetical protein
MFANLTRLPRDEFFSGGYYEYRKGQHQAFIEPTGGGKTRLKYQCLRAAMEQNPGLPVVTTIPKRRDAGTAAWNRALGLREIPVWPPPPRRLFEPRPAGHALWPRHVNGRPGDDPDVILAADRAHIERQFKNCAMQAYQDGDIIYDADDIFVQAVILHMNEQFSVMWTMGGVMGCGVWGANQKPSGTREGADNSFFYNSASWLFLGYDQDERNRERFGEIGGVDKKYVSGVVQNLEVHHINGNNISDKLVITKSSGGPEGPAMCILGP